MLSIVITTFKYRFEKYLKPLLNAIKQFEPEIEIIVTINGEHKEKFDQEYRKNILEFCALHNNVFPIMFPEFRSLSKLWNTGIIHSSNEYILLLNDDVLITDPNFINIVRSGINQHQTSFKINGSWSHVVLKKMEVIDAGWFDLRLRFLGEEDGDFEWRYCGKFNKGMFLNFSIPGIINYVDMSISPKGVPVISQGKYSKPNQDAMYNLLYKIDNINGIRRGVCPAKLVVNEPLKEQYPYEKFYLENRDKL